MLFLPKFYIPKSLFALSHSLHVFLNDICIMSGLSVSISACYFF